MTSRRVLVVTMLLSACSSDPASQPTGGVASGGGGAGAAGGAGSSPSGGTAGAAGGTDAGGAAGSAGAGGGAGTGGAIDGGAGGAVDGGGPDGAATAPSCEDQFFFAQFAKHNQAPTGTSLTKPREAALSAIKAYVQKLNACGAKVTLGNMMALLLYEGAFRVGAFNTLCEENSYNKTATNCDADPEALYSYQYGLGAIHTSNFHPCKGGAWTQKMRAMLLAQMSQAGFSTASSLLTAEQKSRFAQICPGATANAVDHYLLGAHSAYGVPKDATGNHLSGYGKFPLFDPATSIALSLYPIEAACSKVTSDRAAIATWGGGDSSYGTTAKQDQIMASWKSFAATCK